jgi:hypothetical protein
MFDKWWCTQGPAHPTGQFHVAASRHRTGILSPVVEGGPCEPPCLIDDGLRQEGCAGRIRSAHFCWSFVISPVNQLVCLILGFHLAMRTSELFSVRKFRARHNLRAATLAKKNPSAHQKYRRGRASEPCCRLRRWTALLRFPDSRLRTCPARISRVRQPARLRRQTFPFPLPALGSRRLED